MFTNLYSFCSNKKPVWVTQGVSLPNGGAFMGGSGVTNAAIMYGGQWSQGGYLGQAFTWNGSTWAAAASMIVNAGIWLTVETQLKHLALVVAQITLTILLTISF